MIFKFELQMKEKAEKPSIPFEMILLEIVEFN